MRSGGLRRSVGHAQIQHVSRATLPNTAHWIQWGFGRVGKRHTSPLGMAIRRWSMHEELAGLADRLARTPTQLDVQGVVTSQVIARAIEHATLFFCQRRPKELGIFHWVIDAKGSITQRCHGGQTIGLVSCRPASATERTSFEGDRGHPCRMREVPLPAHGHLACRRFGSAYKLGRDLSSQSGTRARKTLSDDRNTLFSQFPWPGRNGDDGR